MCIYQLTLGLMEEVQYDYQYGVSVLPELFWLILWLQTNTMKTITTNMLMSTYLKLMYNGMCGGFPMPHKGINFQHNLHKVVDQKDFINKVTKPC